jgi:hypothetical protein
MPQRRAVRFGRDWSSFGDRRQFAIGVSEIEDLVPILIDTCWIGSVSIDGAVDWNANIIHVPHHSLF